MSDPIEYGQLESGKDCNYWALDPTFRRAARRAYDPETYEWAASRLDWLGEETGTRIVENSELVEAHPPELHTYDRDGEVQNHVDYHPALLDTERATYCEYGLSHDAFHAPEGRDEPAGLLHAIVSEAMLSFADPGFVCPASMTVGAALVLDRFAENGERSADDVVADYLDRMTTTDPDRYVEGAMFLTEKQGGSDVGANETVAVETDEPGVYELTGEKWFCSNIDAEGTLALARREGAPEGTKGLSMFVVPHTVAADAADGNDDVDGSEGNDGSEVDDGSEGASRLNDQLYRRLKDKLGTLSVPTGEVELQGATGYLVGEPERGFRQMTEMLNFERLSNAAASVGIMGRVLLESKVHAANREAFGSPIQEYPLMKRDLVEMQVTYEAATHFTFAAARLLDDYHAVWDRADAGEDVEPRESAPYRLMRLLVPVAKYRTARDAVDTASYACEVLGGNGYVTGFATERMLRDAQVLPIWEGTSNILSLDVLRVLARENAAEVFIDAVTERLDAAEAHDALAEDVATVRTEFESLQGAMLSLATEDDEYAQLQAKELADYIYDVFTAAELLACAAADLEGTAPESADREASARTADARLAVVASAFVTDRFGRPDARGITAGDRLALQWFDAVVRHASVAPDAVASEPAPADD